MITTLIFIISLLGFILSLVMVFQEKKNSGRCPRFAHIPACYIVSFSYVFVSISMVMIPNWLQELFFWSGSAIGIILAFWFSFHKIRGTKQCPTISILSLCFVSFVVFTTLMVLKLLT